MARGRKPGESRRLILDALASGARMEKQLMVDLGITARWSITRLTAELQREGLIAKGFSLTEAGRAALENDHV